MTKRHWFAWLVPVVLAGLLAGCGERPPMNTVQVGYRGTGIEQVYNPRILAMQTPVNTPPEVLDAASPDGPKAGQVYQNVQVLGHLSVGQFARLMTAMTNWVSPNEGCAYCHNLQNFAEDSKYTKVVARRMTQMTQNINAQWKTHVAETGVTCYTCHRGNPVPTNVWYGAPDQEQAMRLSGNKAGQNTPVKSSGYASLPYDTFTPYLLQAGDSRVNGATALPTGNRSSIKQTEFTYGLMMHMSSSLGVNCTYCHNSRQFSSWEESSPKRVTAWYGIRLARDINVNYVEPLAPIHPPERLGPRGDVGKVNCATCHQGAYKPLYGAKMLDAHPELAAPGPQQVAQAAAAAAPAAMVAPEIAAAAAGVPAPAAAAVPDPTVVPGPAAVQVPVPTPAPAR